MVGYFLEYGLQKNYEKWQIITGNGNKIITDTGNDSLPKTVTKNNLETGEIITDLGETITENGNKIITETGQHKNNKHITKAISEGNSKNNVLVLPDWINKLTWGAFLEVRKKKKTPNTHYALALIIKDLKKLKDEGEDPNSALEKSIKHGWTGVLWESNNGNPGGKPAAGNPYKEFEFEGEDDDAK